MTVTLSPFAIDIPEAALDDLRARLDMTRWPEPEPVDDWSQGAPIDRMRGLCDYWRRDYDWRRCEARLNGMGSQRAEVDGLGIHVLHIRSPEPDALPMIMTHGWPGSVIEFMDVIGPLTDPAAHGGDAADAFHLVLPSLPGYGFSDKPARSGCGVERIAEIWAQLMPALGYDRYVAQGGDWGSAVTTAMGTLAPRGLEAIHLNMPSFPLDRRDPSEDPAIRRAIEANARHRRWGTGYSRVQSTRPQTLGYGLTDSPVGQAAWIYEKYQEYTDHDGDAEALLGRDAMLDNIMLYWLPAAGASSARLYWESFGGRAIPQVHIPTAATVFPREIVPAPRAWSEKIYTNIHRWTEAERGGHFAAFEQPEIFTREVRDAFRAFR